MDNKTPHQIKVCLYLEYYHFFGGFMFKNMGTGIVSSYKNQQAMLKSLNIPFTEKWDDSCDIFQTNTQWIRSIYLMKKARRRGKKIIIWAHVTVEDGMAVFRFIRYIAPLLKKYYTYAYGLADVVFCPTEYTKTLLLGYGLPEKKLQVQSNAVDLKKFYVDEGKRQTGRAKFNLQKMTVGTVGQVNPRKGVDTFLELAGKFTDNQFLWVGNFFSPLLVKPLHKNPPANVKFTGYVEDILEGFNALDIFIFPSYEENQGMVILEAAAVGLPILVRDIPAYSHWLVHGQNCLKAKNNQEFESYLKMLLTDGDLRVKLSQNAKILAEHESLEALGQKLKRVYENLVYGN